MSKELDEFEEMYNWIYCNCGTTYEDDVKLDRIRTNVKRVLQRLEAIEDAKPTEALVDLEKIKIGFGCDMAYYDLNLEYESIKQALLKTQSLEKENEILKEIIKSLFDRGYPLHQYTDKDLGLTIEVDDECSTMHLGEFKGVDLDKKLKEVLE